MTLHVMPWRVAGMLGAVIVGLAAYGATAILLYGAWPSRHQTLIRMFDLRSEGNAASFYTALILIGAALACLANAAPGSNGVFWRVRPGFPGWRFLALVFVFLAFDEAAQFHEQISRFKPGWSGGLAFVNERAWVLFYLPAAALAALAFLPFLLRLPRRTALLVVASGVLYVVGAIGLELVGSWQQHVGGLTKADTALALRALAEEAVESLSICLFIGAAIEHAAGSSVAVTLVMVSEKSASPAPAVPGIGDPAGDVPLSQGMPAVVEVREGCAPLVVVPAARARAGP